MSFNAAQKVSLRRYLGFPLGYYDLNSRFESMMDTVGASAEEQAAVESILTELAAVDMALASAGTTTTTTGALAQVDEIKWHPPTTTTTGSSVVDALSRGKMLINRLAACFGFSTDELPSLYFSKGSNRGNELALG